MSISLDTFFITPKHYTVWSYKLQVIATKYYFGGNKNVGWFKKIYLVNIAKQTLLTEPNFIYSFLIVIRDSITGPVYTYSLLFWKITLNNEV